VNKKQVLEIKTKILKDIEFLHVEIKDLKEKTKPIAPDCSLGRLTRMEMIGEQQVHEHALHEAQIRLNKLEYALRKVDSEDYGICMECEENIPFNRLLLVPESSFCISCATNR